MRFMWPRPISAGRLSGLQCQALFVTTQGRLRLVDGRQRVGKNPVQIGLRRPQFDGFLEQADRFVEAAAFDEKTGEIAVTGLEIRRELNDPPQQAFGSGVTCVVACNFGQQPQGTDVLRIFAEYFTADFFGTFRLAGQAQLRCFGECATDRRQGKKAVPVRHRLQPVDRNGRAPSQGPIVLTLAADPV